MKKRKADSKEFANRIEVIVLIVLFSAFFFFLFILLHYLLCGEAHADELHNVETVEQTEMTTYASDREYDTVLVGIGAKNSLTTKKEIEKETEKEEDEFYWDGPVLNSYLGTVTGPSGKETYYNLPMGGVVSIMRDAGFSEEEYPYWERDDGCKMLGDYIMVAADLNLRPRGSVVDCSLGKAIVCDTGEFIYSNPQQLDVAVTW